VRAASAIDEADASPALQDSKTSELNGNKNNNENVSRSVCHQCVRRQLSVAFWYMVWYGVPWYGIVRPVAQIMYCQVFLTFFPFFAFSFLWPPFLAFSAFVGHFIFLVTHPIGTCPCALAVRPFADFKLFKTQCK